jgi:hypothetical protein
MKGVPALSPLPRWGTTPGEGEFNLFSAPINNMMWQIKEEIIPFKTGMIFLKYGICFCIRRRISTF